MATPQQYRTQGLLPKALADVPGKVAKLARENFPFFPQAKPRTPVNKGFSNANPAMQPSAQYAAPARPAALAPPTIAAPRAAVPTLPRISAPAPRASAPAAPSALTPPSYTTRPPSSGTAPGTSASAGGAAGGGGPSGASPMDAGSSNAGNAPMGNTGNPSAPAAASPAPSAAFAAEAAPQNFGFERYMSEQMNLSGQRFSKGSNNKGFIYEKGPLKGYGQSDGEEFLRKQYAALGEDVKQRYTNQANGNDIRSQSEKDEAAARANGTYGASPAPSQQFAGSSPNGATPTRGMAPTTSGSMDAGASNYQDPEKNGMNFDYFNSKRENRMAQAASSAMGDLATGAQAQAQRSGVSAAAGMNDEARVVAARRQARTGDTNGLASREQRASEALQKTDPKLDNSTNRNLVRGGWSR
jgi:hypothetical protein